MDLVNTIANAAVITALGLVMGWYLRSQFRLVREDIAGIHRRIDHLETRLDGRVDRLEERTDRGFDSLRSDLTGLALAMGARPATEAGEA